MAVISKLRYLRRVAVQRLSNRDRCCPNCGGQRSALVSTKYVVTQLRRCEDCLLMYRDPPDPPGFGELFYNEKYRAGFTTDLPGERELQKFMQTQFRGTPKDYSRYVSILLALGIRPGMKLLDYGCSWGYGTWQLQQIGFECWGFDISASRTRYATDNLGVRIVENLQEFRAHPQNLGAFDCFFAAHVLEHVAAPTQVIELAGALLKRGGLLVAFMPNGSAECRRTCTTWDKWWGEAHPNLIDDAFLEHALGDVPKLVAATPIDLSALESVALRRRETVRFDLSGSELMVVARKLGVGRRWIK